LKVQLSIRSPTSYLFHIEVSPTGKNFISRSISQDFVDSWSAAAKYVYRNELTAEILGADEILISSPLWNWSIPSVLKAYFDQIIMSGTLDASGAQGLKGKKVTFVLAQGDSYKPGTPRAGWDHGTGYLKFLANLLGATDIHIILAELTLPGIAPRMQALTGAKAASVDAAREAARMRAASALSVIFPNEGYLSLGKITQGIHPNCYLFALLYSRVNPVQTNNLRMHRGEKYGSTCCFAERSRQVF
jgi:FMN-dependent NADH-azoreductase